MRIVYDTRGATSTFDCEFGSKCASRSFALPQPITPIR